MKKIKKLVLLIFFLAATRVLAEESAQPTYKVGETWRIEYDHTYPISATNILRKGIYDIVWNGKDGEIYRVDGDQRTFYINLSGLDSAPFQFLPLMTRGDSCDIIDLPLSAGKNWEKDCLSRHLAGKGGEMKVKTTQEVSERTVTVPAGTFRTFKIEREEGKGTSLQRKYVVFYAGELGSVVQFYLRLLDGGKTGSRFEFKLLNHGFGGQGKIPGT